MGTIIILSEENHIVSKSNITVSDVDLENGVRLSFEYLHKILNEDITFTCCDYNNQLINSRISILCDDNALMTMEPKEPALAFIDGSDIVSCIHGQIVFVGVSSNGEYYVPLDEEQVSLINKLLSKNVLAYTRDRMAMRIFSLPCDY